MFRRVIAALAALALAAVGIVLVIAYAGAADQRALAGQEVVEVLVAETAISEGTSGGQLAEMVERKPVPKAYVVEGSVEQLSQLEGQVATTDIAAGEQIVAARFATPEQIRAAGEFQLPEEAESLHQVTIPLEKPRALGGNIAAGDTVGVFVSLEPKSGGGDDESEPPSMTHLTLHKVLVTRVAGGYVQPPSEPDSNQDEDNNAAAQQEAAETVLVTLALPAKDAERLVFGMEWGQVWLSYEPENADENGTEVVVVTIPDTVRDVYE